MSKTGSYRFMMVHPARILCLLAVCVCLPAGLYDTASAQPVQSGLNPPNAPYGAGLTMGMVLSIFILTMGPIKLISPFARLTTSMSTPEMRRTAAMAFLFSCAGGLVAAVAGQYILNSWVIPLPVLQLAAGVVLFLVALKSVLEQYKPVNSAAAPAPDVVPRKITLSPLTFPVILTPHGIAALILILSITHDSQKDLYIGLIFLAVMIVNWVIMLLARHIMRMGGVLLEILGAVLSVLQVALGLKVIWRAFLLMQSGEAM